MQTNHREKQGIRAQKIDNMKAQETKTITFITEKQQYYSKDLLQNTLRSTKWRMDEGDRETRRNVN